MKFTKTYIGALFLSSALLLTSCEAVQNSNIESIAIFPNQVISFIYSGGDCQYGWGDVDLKLVDATHVKWRYQPEGVILTNLNCPNGADTTIYLPKTPDLVFTKQ
ncbi:hypothetical protein GCM10009853_101160 [Glycomyces scopariae]